MLVLDLTGCGSVAILKIIYFIKLLLQIAFILVPIALIVFITIDLFKAVMAKDDGEQKKAVKITVKRLIYTVALFFVPTIVSIANNALGSLGVDYAKCLSNISKEEINRLEAEEARNNSVSNDGVTLTATFIADTGTLIGDVQCDSNGGNCKIELTCTTTNGSCTINNLPSASSKYKFTGWGSPSDCTLGNTTGTLTLTKNTTFYACYDRTQSNPRFEGR